MCQEPPLTIYHDLVTAAEIRYMKAAVLRDLMVATIVDTEDSSGDGKKVSNERTQSSGWLWEQVNSRGVHGLVAGPVCHCYPLHVVYLNTFNGISLHQGNITMELNNHYNN